MMEFKEEQLNTIPMFILTGEIFKASHLGLDLSPISKELMERSFLSDFWHLLQLEVQLITVLPSKSNSSKLSYKEVSTSWPVL